MRILLSGLAVFGIAFLLHFVIWKIRLPKNQTPALLVIFFGMLAAAAACMYLTSALGTFTEYLQFCILFSSLALAYITTYSAMEVDSPSLMMVLAIAKEGRSGLAKDKFEELMNDSTLIIPRVNDLVNAKLLIQKGSLFYISPKALAISRLFIFYRGLLGLGKGG